MECVAVTAAFLFADASARFLPYAAEPLMMAIGTRGGEVVSLPGKP
jgi:hypothetical protein